MALDEKLLVGNGGNYLHTSGGSSENYVNSSGNGGNFDGGSETNFGGESEAVAAAEQLLIDEAFTRIAEGLGVVATPQSGELTL